MLFNYLYTTFLTILFTLVMSLSFGAYLKEHKKHDLLIALYFLLIILNGLLVTMTETFKAFASSYNREFMVNPIIETLYYLAIFAIALTLINRLVQEKIKFYQYGLWIVFAIWLTSVPFLKDSALKVWLYYFPSQALTVYMGIYLLMHYHQLSHKTTLQSYVKIFGWLALVFGLMIVSEDSFVIFFRDIYHTNMLKIHNRNVSEDLFHISLSIVAIKYYLFNYKNATVTSVSEIPLHSINKEMTDKGLEDSQIYFSEFAKRYNLTQRETEILTLLCQGKHNQEIANELYLSLGTVKTHTHNIFIKLQVEKRSEVSEMWKHFRKEFE